MAAKLSIIYKKHKPFLIKITFSIKI